MYNFCVCGSLTAYFEDLRSILKREARMRRDWLYLSIAALFQVNRAIGLKYTEDTLSMGLVYLR